MKAKFKIVFLLMILNFLEIKTLKNEEKLFTNLAIAIKNFYICQSVIMVHDISEDWQLQGNTFEIIKEFSRNYIKSQTITYEQLRQMTIKEKKYHKADSNEPLFVLFIYSKKKLGKLQRITNNLNMSLYTWLVLVSSNSGIDCDNPVGNPLSVNVNTRMIVKCAQNRSIKKFYAIFRNVTEVTEMAIWTPDQKLQLTQDKHQLQVNKNMKGIVLRVALQKRRTTHNLNKNVANYLDSLLEALESVSNFTTKITVRNDNLGYRTEEKWTGLIGDMWAKRADIALVFFSMSEDRLDAVDFPVPLLRARLGIYLKMTDTVAIHWSAYFNVFNARTWIAVGIVILVLSGLLTLIKVLLERSKANASLYFENFINVWGVYCQQGIPETPLSSPTKILYLSMLFSALILYSIYAASITSYIAVLKTGLPFSTFKEILEDHTYKLIVLQGSRDERLINSSDWLLSKFKYRLKNSDVLPKDAYTGFQQVCNEKVAFYATNLHFAGVSNKPCSLGAIELPRIEDQSIALVKDGPYTENINYYILRLMNHGIMKRLKSKYFEKFEILADTVQNKISFWDVIPILSIWSMGASISVFIFSIEIIYAILRNRQRNSQQPRRTVY